MQEGVQTYADIVESHEDKPPAVGQVAIIPFQEERPKFSSLSELADFQTALIIKPNALWNTAYFKFCGGMLIDESETFAQAAVRELKQETGIECEDEQLCELYTTQKRRHKPHDGYFPIKIFAAFGCSFTNMHNPTQNQFGDEGEEVILARFGDVLTRGFAWTVPTDSSRLAELFPLHLSWLDNIDCQLQANSAAQ